jgi:hypothetical protein
MGIEFLEIVGLVTIIYGIVIWKKQKLDWVYGYNLRKVRQEDIKGYTKSMGMVSIVFGSFTLLLAMFKIFNNGYYQSIGIVLWFVGLIISYVLNVKTQKKYHVGRFV